MSSAARGEHISAILIIIEEYHVRKPFGGSCGSRQWCRLQRRRKLGTRGAMPLPDFADIEKRTGSEYIQTISKSPPPPDFWTFHRLCGARLVGTKSLLLPYLDMYVQTVHRLFLTKYVIHDIIICRMYILANKYQIPSNLY